MLKRMLGCIGDDRSVCISLCLIQLIYFLFNVGETMLDVTIRPHMVDLVCERHYNQSICRHLTDNTEYINVIHADSGMYFTIYKVLLNVPTYFCGLYFGQWSDVYGRKVPMAIPIVGSMLAVGIYTISIYVKTWAIDIILAGSFVQGMFGKGAVIAMAVNSYTSENSTVEQRTSMLGRLLAMQYFGKCVGALAAGLMAFNIRAAFGIIGGVHIVGLLTVIIGVKVKDKEKEQIPTAFCSKLYCLDGIKSTLFLLIKQRPNKGLCLINLVFTISILHGLVVVVQQDLVLFVVTGQPLRWSNSNYSYLLSFANISTGISLLIIIPLLAHFFHLSDFDVLLFGLSCIIIFYTSIQFATSIAVIYFLMFVWSFSVNARNCVRSILSKSVETNDLGKIFSLLSCFDTTAKVLGPLIFLNIYGATLNINRWIVFYVMIGVGVIAIGLCVFAKRGHKKLAVDNEVTSLILSGNDASEDDKVDDEKAEKRKRDHVTCYSSFQ